MKLKPITIAAILMISLSACKSIKPVVELAPEYEQPTVAVPETFAFDLPATEAASIQAASLGWRDYFADPRLHALIELALKNNTNLRTAALNVEQVRAQYAITRTSQEMPNISGTAGATRSGALAHTGTNRFNIGLSTGYELDLWGRVKNSSEAALESYFATTAAKDATHLTLISQVAKAHLNELYAQAAMDLAKRTLSSYEETYRLAKIRHQAGVISAVDLRAQEAQIESAKSTYAGAVRAREQARNALALLINQPIPKNLPKAKPLSQQFKINNLPAGLSSQVLLNRPDIRAAEHQLRQANANIGVARAAFYPKISLTGTLGLISPQLGNLFQTNKGSWSAGANLSVPIFDWGTNKANLEAVKIEQQKKVVAYEAAVQSAFKDVADALVARAALAAQFESVSAQRKAYNERLRLIHLRYKHGVASSLDLLDAERSSYNSDNAVLNTQLNLLENLVDVYKALGGGLKRYTTDAQDSAGVRAAMANTPSSQQEVYVPANVKAE